MDRCEMAIIVIFDLPDGGQKECHAEAGQTLLQVAQDNGIELEGACEGTLACATCHVVVDPAWYGKLPPPSGDEIAMLVLAEGRARTSRLSCQIKLTGALGGLTARLP
jgi:ferredoxin